MSCGETCQLVSTANDWQEDEDTFASHWIVVKVNVLSGEFVSAGIEG